MAKKRKQPKRKAKRKQRAEKRKETGNSTPSAAIVRVSAPPERTWELTPDEVAIVKNSIAKGSTDEELKFCLTVARRYRLDPFKKQIWFVPRWDSGADNGHGGKGATVYTPQVGIDGLLFAAARDHRRDFGSISLPTFGPMIEQEWWNEYTKKTVKFMAPEWARVKVWKKGETEPTEAEAWWTEYAPADFSKAPFWCKLPRRMLSKCAKSLAIKETYPDLGGLYIPEEMERMSQEFAQDLTPGGRQIVDDKGFAPSGRAVTYGAQNRASTEDIENLKAKGLWCEKHQCTNSAKHLRECDAVVDAQGGSQAHETTAKSPLPPQPWKQPEPKPLPRGNAINVPTDSPQSGAPPKAPGVPQGASGAAPSRGTVTVDASNPPDFIVTGDLGDISLTLEGRHVIVWHAGNWHASERGVVDIETFCKENGYQFKLIRSRSSAGLQSQAMTPAESRQRGGSGSGPKPESGAPGVVTLRGTIERVIIATDAKSAQVTLVTADGKKPCWKCWDKTVYGILSKNLGKDAEVILKQNKQWTNLVGLKRVGKTTFEEDGKTACLDVNREPGTPSMFK